MPHPLSCRRASPLAMQTVDLRGLLLEEYCHSPRALGDLWQDGRADVGRCPQIDCEVEPIGFLGVPPSIGLNF